ncbi:ATP-dependent Clp protease proteolytic subunit [Oceanobacillus sp. FSL H7-0719]|uniref:ATP-dependent Clp protease proteolytic subunit n=1 Tax=Oceanobacillus sp. FSL H7-0719 TaxID=2954507 RepID=UPI00324E3F13
MEFILEGLDESKVSWTDKIDKDLYTSRKVYLNEYITQYSFNNIIPLIEHINLIDDEADVEYRNPIELIINSGGGSFHDGIAIITAIKRSRTPVYGLVYSYAYSMGLAILEACDKRYLGELGSLLYHEVMTETDGNGSQMKRTQKELERMQNIYDNLITNNSKVTQKMLEEQKEKINDWVIGYEQALELGLIDGSVEDLG